MSSKVKGTRKSVRHAEHPEVRMLEPNSKMEYKQLKKELTSIQKSMYTIKKIEKLVQKLDMEFPKKKQTTRKTVIEQLNRDGVKSDDLHKQSDEELMEHVLEQCNRLFSQIHDIKDEIDRNQTQIVDALRQSKTSSVRDKLSTLEEANRRLYKDKREMSERLTQYGELTNDLEETYESMADEIYHHSDKMLTPPSPNPSPTSPRTVANTLKNQNPHFKYRNQRSQILLANTGGKTRRRRRRPKVLGESI